MLPYIVAYYSTKAFEKENAMKIGVTSYSYQRYLVGGKMDYFEVITKSAELGYEGIEFSGLGVPASDPGCGDLADKIKRACADAGLPIIGYTISADFLRAKGGWRAEAERLKTEVDIAARLGAPCMRHDASFGWPEDHAGPKDFETALPILANGCRAVAQYAAGLGVKTMVENHGTFVQASERCEALQKQVDHENFGALVDIGNFLCADDDPVPAVTRMAPYAVHCHAKDFVVKPAGSPDPGEGWFRTLGGAFLCGTIIGEGEVDIPGCIAALKAGGYDGFLSVEFEGPEEIFEALKTGLANLRKSVAGSP